MNCTNVSVETSGLNNLRIQSEQPLARGNRKEYAVSSELLYSFSFACTLTGFGCLKSLNKVEGPYMASRCIGITFLFAGFVKVFVFIKHNAFLNQNTWELICVFSKWVGCLWTDVAPMSFGLHANLHASLKYRYHISLPLWWSMWYRPTLAQSDSQSANAC